MKNQTAYPDPLAKWSDKIKESYGLSFAKAIGGDWFNGDIITGNCNFNIRKDRIRENRFYVRGENDTKKFKDLFQIWKILGYLFTQPRDKVDCMILVISSSQVTN